MGFYIEPQDPSVTGKLQWLEDHCVEIGQQEASLFFEHRYPEADMCLLCSLGGFPETLFVAIAYVYNSQELAAFMESRDRRTKRWWVCDLKDMEENCPSWRQMHRGGTS